MIENGCVEERGLTLETKNKGTQLDEISIISDRKMYNSSLNKEVN